MEGRWRLEGVLEETPTHHVQPTLEQMEPTTDGTNDLLPGVA